MEGAFGALYTNTPFLFLSPDNPEQDTKNFCQESPEVGLREDFTTIQDPDFEYIKELLTNNTLWELDAKKRKANIRSSSSLTVVKLVNSLQCSYIIDFPKIDIILKCVGFVDAKRLTVNCSIQN